MSFKEKLKRYQEGTASPEEKEEVEKELIKYESIEEYYADDLSNQLFESEEPIKEDETEGIQKVVNQRLRKVVLISVLLVVLLYFGVFYGISSIVDAINYNPTTTSQPVEEHAQRSDFHYDMTAYVSLNMPGYVLSSTTSEESTGFGSYELGYSLRNLFNSEQQLHFMNISRGRLTLARDGIFNHPNRFNSFYGFEEIYRPFPDDAEEDAIEFREYMTTRNNEITLEYLNELNSLSYVSMGIVFDEDLTMEEFHLLRDEHSDLEFKWVGVRTTEPDTRWREDQGMHIVGFNPNFNDEPSSSSRPNPERYPYFDLNDAMGEISIPIEDFPKAYETHFKSRLDYLSNQKEFIELFDSNPSKLDFYKDALNYVNEEGAETYGVLVYGTSEDFLENIEDIPYNSLFIDDVSPTKPYIY